MGFQIRTKEKKAKRIYNTFFLTQIPHSAHCDTGRCGGEVTEVPQKTYHGYLPQRNGQIEVMDKMVDVFEMAIEITMATGAIPTSAASTTVQRDTLFPRMLILSPRVKIVLHRYQSWLLSTHRPLKNKTPESPAYNTRGRAAQKCSIIQKLMLQAIITSNNQLKPYNLDRNKFPLQLLCNMANKVLDSDTRYLLEY